MNRRGKKFHAKDREKLTGPKIPQRSLKQLLTRISKKNLHVAVDSGAPVRCEIW